MTTMHVHEWRSPQAELRIIPERRANLILDFQECLCGETRTVKTWDAWDKETPAT